LIMTVTVAVLTPLVGLAGTAAKAEFVTGTVKSIPANTSGSLDAGSSTELRFRYGKSVFSLPYKDITDAEVTEPVGKHLWKMPVPKVGKGSRFLNISYQDGSESRMLTFKAPAKTVTGLANAINDRRKDPQTATAAAPTTKKGHGNKKLNASKKATSTKKANASKKTPEPVPAQTTPDATKTASIKTDTEVWWGDQYWRTTRNKAKWPEVPAENPSGVPAGTKE
jgi:hypothetical protein